MNRLREEDGSIAIYLVGAVVIVLCVFGLIVDTGGKLRASAQASNVAVEAARAGSQTVNVSQVLVAGQVRPDPTAARNAAISHVTSAGLVPADVTVTPTSVTVTTSGTYTPVFLSIIGITSVEVTGTSTARFDTG